MQDQKQEHEREQELPPKKELVQVIPEIKPHPVVGEIATAELKPNLKLTNDEWPSEDYIRFVVISDTFNKMSQMT